MSKQYVKERRKTDDRPIERMLYSERERSWKKRRVYAKSATSRDTHHSLFPGLLNLRLIRDFVASPLWNLLLCFEFCLLCINLLLNSMDLSLKIWAISWSLSEQCSSRFPLWRSLLVACHLPRTESQCLSWPILSDLSTCTSDFLVIFQYRCSQARTVCTVLEGQCS